MKQRESLAAFEARWKKIDSSAWAVARQVDYRLMGSALARLDCNIEVALIDTEGQKAIADYKVNGQQLFFPNADAPGA